MMKIHKNVFKGLVAMLLLNVGATSFAMHNDWVVVSEAGLRVPVSERVLRLSKTFNDLLTDARGSKEIPTHFSNIQLPQIVHLMQEQDRIGVNDLLMHINGMMRDLTNEQVVSVFNAASYLDLPVILQGLGAVIVNRISNDKNIGALNDLLNTWLNKSVEVQNAARDRLIKTPGLGFLRGIGDKQLFRYLYAALSPERVAIVNKTGNLLKVRLNNAKEHEIKKDGEFFVGFVSGGMGAGNTFSFQTLDSATKKPLSSVREVSGRDMLENFIKLSSQDKRPLQRTLIMTIKPDKGVTGLKDWLVNSITWQAAISGPQGTMSTETETVKLTPKAENQ